MESSTDGVGGARSRIRVSWGEVERSIERGRTQQPFDLQGRGKRKDHPGCEGGNV